MTRTKLSPEQREPTADACLAIALKTNDLSETLRYSSKAAGLYRRLRPANGTSGPEAAAYESRVADKLNVASQLEKSILESLKKEGTESAMVMIARALPRSRYAAVLIRKLRERKEATGTTLTDILDPETNFGPEVDAILNIAAELKELESRFAQYQKQQAYFNFLTASSLQGYTQLMKRAYTLADHAAKNYRQLAIESPGAAERVKSASGVEPNFFIETMENIRENLNSVPKI